MAGETPGALPAPRAFLVNPTVSAVDVVWDEPRDPRIRGYEIVWRGRDESDWQGQVVPRVRRHRVAGLEDGSVLTFRARSVAPGLASEWTPGLETRVGAVPMVDTSTVLSEASWWLALRTFYYGLVHAFTTP